jgi:apolipoprotein N-acyltransferase
VLTGFPWALLGYAQHRNVPLAALAPWTGVFGLSFAVALGGAAFAELAAARAGGARPPRGAALALVAVAALHGAGALDVARDPGDAGLARLRVAVAQGNIDQGVKWSPEWAGRTLAIYEDLTRRAAAAGAELVAWPETAVPGSPDADPELADWLAGLARETGASLVVGGLGYQERAGRRRFWDSAFVWDREGAFVARYDKAHLVPFGEYVPLRDFLGRFVEAIARGAADTDVSAGPGPRALRLPSAGGASVTVGVPICYELLFPDLVRRFTADGAEALVAITNDAWYGRTGAPYQFLAITALRAAESRLWIARAANTGVSALIDDRGRVRERTGIFERDVRVGEIVLRPAPHGGSFYVRHGDWFAWSCWAASAILLAAATVRRRRSGATSGTGGETRSRR